MKCNNWVEGVKTSKPSRFYLEQWKLLFLVSQIRFEPGVPPLPTVWSATVTTSLCCLPWKSLALSSCGATTVTHSGSGTSLLVPSWSVCICDQGLLLLISSPPKMIIKSWGFLARGPLWLSHSLDIWTLMESINMSQGSSWRGDVTDAVCIKAVWWTIHRSWGGCTFPLAVCHLKGMIGLLVKFQHR